VVKVKINIEYERLRSRERIVVAVCVTLFGIICLIHGVNHAVIAAVAGVLGAILGRRVWLPKA